LRQIGENGIDNCFERSNGYVVEEGDKELYGLEGVGVVGNEKGSEEVSVGGEERGEEGREGRSVRGKGNEGEEGKSVVGDGERRRGRRGASVEEGKEFGVRVKGE